MHYLALSNVAESAVSAEASPAAVQAPGAPAGAAPGAPAGAAPSAAAPSAPAPVEPESTRYAWTLAVTSGYFVPAQNIAGLSVDPYGLQLGVQATHSWANGLWLGLRGDFFLGRTVTQPLDGPFVSQPGTINATSQLSAFSLSMGYDVDLHYLIFRYGVDLGASLMGWNFVPVPNQSVPGFDALTGSVVGLHVTPSLGLYVPIGALFVGVEGRFRVESATQIPAGYGTNLSLGWRFW